MNTRKLASDMVVAFFAQALSIASSVATTLILPKILGVESFGYWQLFLFYVSYIGFFHLGLNDGVYLIHGGKRRSEIRKKEINSQFAFSCFYQILFSIIISAIGIFGPFEEERRFVIFAASILLTINNAGAFLGYVFQAMNETKLFSKSIVVESAVLFSGLAVMLVLGIEDFKLYILLFCASKTIRLLFCIINAHDFIASGIEPLGRLIRQSIISISVGIKLLFANIAGQLILGVARFYVDLEWGIETFSIVSFSLSITTFFLMFLTQVSMVLFPHLKQSNKNSIETYYVLLRDSLAVLLPALYLLYPLISAVLNFWLPEYSQSIQLFIFLFPLCVFEGKMDIVCTTYFKVLRLEGKLLAITCWTLLASLAATLVGTYIFHSIIVILASIAFILGMRCLISERIVEAKLDVSHASVSWGTLIISIVFVAAFCAFNQFYAILVYIFCYAIFLFINRKPFRTVLKSFKRLIIGKS